MANAHFNLATIYADDKRFREAADEYAAALKLEPDNDVTRLALAKAYAESANYQEALSCGQRVCEAEAGGLGRALYARERLPRSWPIRGG